MLPLLLALVCAVSAAARQPSPETERRVEELLARMTLEEKVGQLHLAPNNPAFDRDAVARGRVGGVLAFTDPRDIADVQAVARGSRLGIPLLVGLDVLHGLRTMYPLPLGEAASFDPGLAAEVARAAASEASALGFNWTFAPMADLARDPRWGRMIEGFGEDPHLGAVFTAARVRGFRKGGLAVTLKHFAGYGAGEGGRDYDAAAIPTGDLHDLHLPPFRAGIEAGAESVMSAFHALNGMPATANRALLTDILRGRLGFDGFVVSDWLAIEQLVDHGVAAGGVEAGRLALAAGVDLDMSSGLYDRHLAEDVRAGRVPEAEVTEAARRVIRTKLRMGLLDRPPTQAAASGLPPPPDQARRTLARRAAADTIVLLRNEGALPLRGAPRLAVIGGMAASREIVVGPHAALWQAEDGVSLLDGLRRRAERAGGQVTFAQGCDALCLSPDGFGEALAAARDADLVVAVLGEPIEYTGEGASRARLTLPNLQRELLDGLLATGKPVILVLLASRPIELGDAVNRLAALAMAWYPGTEGGNAVADILFGDVEPSAKLPVTWPRTIGQVPLTYDRRPSGRPHDPGNRFTLRYADEILSPLFPFGFGMTYTRFEISAATVAAPRLRRDATLEVAVRVANRGDRPGRTVVQLYVRQPLARVSRPLRQLKAFSKVALGPGESRIVTLQVPAADLGYTDEAGLYRVEPGRFQVFVGDISEAPLSGEFEILPD